MIIVFFFSSIECRMIIVGINLPNAMMDRPCTYFVISYFSASRRAAGIGERRKWRST